MKYKKVEKKVRKRERREKRKGVTRKGRILWAIQVSTLLKGVTPFSLVGRF